MYVAAHYAVYIATTISYVSCSQLHDLTPSSALAAGRERVAAAEHQGPVDAADRRLHEEAGRGEGAGGAAHPHARWELVVGLAPVVGSVSHSTTCVWKTLGDYKSRVEDR